MVVALAGAVFASSCGYLMSVAGLAHVFGDAAGGPAHAHAAHHLGHAVDHARPGDADPASPACCDSGDTWLTSRGPDSGLAASSAVLPRAPAAEPAPVLTGILPSLAEDSRPPTGWWHAGEAARTAERPVYLLTQRIRI